jgi:hypothetical protein
MQDISFWLGIALVIVGCLMLAHTNAHAGPNEIRLLGMIFRVSHPVLVIIVLGFLLVVLNDHPSNSVDIPDAFLMPEPPVAPETTVPALPDPATPAADAEMLSELAAGQVVLPEAGVLASEDVSAAASPAADAAAADAAAAALATGLEAPAAESAGPTPVTSPTQQNR